MMKVFYENYGLEKGIPAEKAKMADEEYALSIFYEFLDESLGLYQDSFLGIIDENDTTLQFMALEDRWLVEIPNPPSLINYQMYLDYGEECIDLIKDCFALGKIEVLPGMVKVDIMNETLDDVLYK